MCRECGQDECDCSCPNAEEPKTLECEGCCDDIYSGQVYYLIGDKIYCEDCIKDARRTVD